MAPRPLDLAFTSTKDPAGVREYLFGLSSDLQQLSGYAIADQQPDRIEFEAFTRSPWVYVGCVLLFPIGLLLLTMQKQRHHVLFAIEAPPRDADSHARCLLRVTGRCSIRVDGYLTALDTVASLDRYLV